MRSVPITISHRGVNRAINLIQRDPCAFLDLDEIADAACLSKFHFSRLFRNCTGETPVSFLWRTRLENSALNFDYGADKSITEAALDYGFSSPEAFSRAFSRTMGLSPRSFVSGIDRFTPQIAPRILACAQVQGGVRIAKIIPPADTSVRIEHLPAYRVAYLRRKGPYNYYGNRRSGIGDAFRTVVRRARAHGVLTPDSIAIGVGHNSPRLTRPENCLYDTCVSTGGSFAHTPDLDEQVLDGGRFAVLSVTCPTWMIAEYWNWFTFDWLPRSGETTNAGASLERYEVAEVFSNAAALRVDLCLRLGARDQKFRTVRVDRG